MIFIPYVDTKIACKVEVYTQKYRQTDIKQYALFHLIQGAQKIFIPYLSEHFIITLQMLQHTINAQFYTTR